MGRLSQIADEYAKTPVNTFYISAPQSEDTPHEKIVGYDPTVDYGFIYAYWKEGNSILILYPPYNVEDVTYLSWAYSGRRIDLSRDVMNEDDPNWGQSSITTKGVKMLLNLCVKKGTKIIIDKAHSVKKPSQ